MPDYTINPNKTDFCTVGVVRGVPEILTTKSNTTYVRFRFSVDSNMPLRTVSVFDDNAVKEARELTDKDVAFVAGCEEKVTKGDKEYFNVTAKCCFLIDKLYAALGRMSAPAPAAAPAAFGDIMFTDVKDSELPF